MTEQELRKLNRLELLELLLEEVRENERLRAQLAEANRKLQDRQIQSERAGSIAQAALQLNGVFEAAQKAAAQYVENVRRLADERYGAPAQVAQRAAQQSVQSARQPATTAYASTPSPAPRHATPAFAYDPAFAPASQRTSQHVSQPVPQPAPQHAQRPAPRPAAPAEDEDPYEAAARRFVASIREGRQRP